VFLDAFEEPEDVGYANVIQRFLYFAGGKT